MAEALIAFGGPVALPVPASSTMNAPRSVPMITTLRSADVLTDVGCMLMGVRHIAFDGSSVDISSTVYPLAASIP